MKPLSPQPAAAPRRPTARIQLTPYRRHASLAPAARASYYNALCAFLQPQPPQVPARTVHLVDTSAR